MKNKLLTVFTICCLMLSGCTSTDPVSPPNLVNAENYGGIQLQTSTESAAPPDTTPPTTTSPPDTSTAAPSTSATDIATESSAEASTEAATTTTTTAKTTASTTTPATSGTTAATTKATTQTTTATTTTAATTAPPELPEISANGYTALNHAEMKAVWISYLELGPILIGKGESAFKASFATMLDNCANLGINTVYVHARPFGDSYYSSEYYPWSKYASGSIGTSASFDPLQIMVDEAHKRNISFHAWINPLRLGTTADMMQIDKSYLTSKWYNGNEMGDYVVQSGNYWFLNPAYPEVRSLIINGAKEIVSRYQVDGIHIDDYFYPTTSKVFDDISFAASGETSLSLFRFNNINTLIKGLNSGIKSTNSTVLFGISPQGSIENNKNYLYADVESWCKSTTYCDYIAPQIYYGFDNQLQPYAECLGRWATLTKNSNVRLVPGLAVYKIGRVDEWAGDGKYEWQNSTEIIARQIALAQSQPGYSGVALYSYNYLFGSESKSSSIANEIAALKPLL